MTSTPDPVAASKSEAEAEAETETPAPAAAALLRPRHAAADAFEQNPLELMTGKPGSVPGDRITPAEAALMDAGRLTGSPDLVSIPEAARLRFAGNQERVLEETEAAAAAEIPQHSWRTFAQSFWLTAWLYSEGNLQRGVLAGAACAAAGLILTSSFLLADITAAAAAAPPPAPSRTRQTLQEAPLQDDDALMRQAVETVQKFLRAPGREQRLSLVRQPERARVLMDEYHLTHPDIPITDAVLAFGVCSGSVSSLKFEIPSQNRPHFFKVVRDRRSGAVLVDWETSSLFQEANLEQLRRTRARNPVRVFVIAGAGDYHNHSFRDKRQWTCYRLAYPGLDMDLYGYAPADSPDAGALDTLLVNNPLPPVVLEVRYPENPRAENQVEILRVVSEKWLPEES